MGLAAVDVSGVSGAEPTTASFKLLPIQSAPDDDDDSSMASADAKADIFTTNPYDAHSGLSATEAAVLWEYAKLSQHLKDLVTTTRKLSEEPDETLLAQLRVLERKMGLVLTLYKASVWAVIHDQPVADATGSYEASADLTVRH